MSWNVKYVQRRCWWSQVCRKQLRQVVRCRRETLLLTKSELWSLLGINWVDFLNFIKTKNQSWKIFNWDGRLLQEAIKTSGQRINFASDKITTWTTSTLQSYCVFSLFSIAPPRDFQSNPYLIYSFRCDIRLRRHFFFLWMRFY